MHWLPSYTNDTDCDRWRDALEDHIGTDPEDDCTDQPGDADAWPPDINRDTWADILDVLMFKFKFTDAGYPYDPRFDFNADDCVDILDVLMFKPVLNMRCTP